MGMVGANKWIPCAVIKHGTGTLPGNGNRLRINGGFYSQVWSPEGKSNPRPGLSQMWDRNPGMTSTGAHINHDLSVLYALVYKSVECASCISSHTIRVY